MCSYNNNIPINIPSHPYILLNRSILCNCDLEAERNFLLESLAACGNSETVLVMYFTVSLAFVNFFDNLTRSLGVPIIRNWTTQGQILPILLEPFEMNASLLTAPKMLKDFVNQFRHKKEIQDLQECMGEERSKQSSKFKSFLNSFLADVILFAAALLTITVTLVIIYVVCRQSKLKTLVANIALQCIQGTEAADPGFQDVNCTCKMQLYIIGMLLIILLGMIYLVTNGIRKSSLFEGHLLSNVTKVMLLISDIQSYVPVNLGKITGSIHLFKIRGKLTTENIKFKKNWIWDVLEIDQKEVKVTLNGNEINLLTSVILPFSDKFQARKLIENQPLLLHVMLKQGKTWFTLENENVDKITTANTVSLSILS